MLKISKSQIKKIAVDETVYSRGLRYYKNNAIVNVTWSNINKQYRAIVKGKSNYVVTVDVKEDGSFTHSCNCPAAVKYEGACKHVIATLLFISDYVERQENVAPTDPDEKKIYSIIEYFNRQSNTKLYGETFHIKVTITIPAILKKTTGKAFVSLHAGSSKLYKVQSIKKFLSDYYNKENIALGKEFNYLSGESRFDSTSKAILDYLLEIYEIQEALGKVYYSNLFTKSQMVFTKNMVLKLLSLVDNQSFDLELYGKSYEDVTYMEANPKVKYELDISEDTISVDYNSDIDIIPITDNGEILYSNGVIYKPMEEFIKNYVPFYNTLGKDKKPLEFKGANKEKFLEVVLPKINETMDIDIPNDIKEKYIVSELKTRIYLDKIKNSIKGDIVFRYGDYEFNPLEDKRTEDVIVVRQPERENDIFDLLESLGFEQFKSYYVMKDDRSIYEFLTDKVNMLSEQCELYYSDEFKGISIRKPGNLTTNLSVKADSNLFEMEFDYEDIPKEELKDLFQSYRLKKKYYRMKNGSFINLEDNNLKNVVDILEYLNLASKDIKDGKVSLAKNNALYLNQAFQESEELAVIKNEEFKQLVDRILNPSTNQYEVPNEITAELRSYQIIGYKWLRTLADNELGGILADDMGLGKTLQSIVYMASIVKEKEKRKEKHHPFLVVCPTSLVYNWQDEINSFAPFLKNAIVTGTPAERQETIESYNTIDVLITSYPLIRRDSEFYKNIEFDTMFIDEAQFIKNANSLNAKSVKTIRANHKFALTGTPIENSLSELWSIFDFVMPYYLLSHTKFLNRYEKPIVKEEDKKALEDLGKHIDPFILRRMKKDVLSELPDKVETKMLTDLTDQQKKIYMSYLENIKAEISSEIRENGVEKSKMKILAALTRLRQICCHPSTFIDNYKGGSGKLELLMEILPDVISNGHRILVFSQFTSMLQIIEGELKSKGISYFYLEGSTPMEQRGDYVRRFNDGEGSVFLISLKAGGTGLNLTGADTVVHYDPWWNPAVEEQATDRVYRIGQTNSVHVIRLITKGTIEEKIYKLQQKKKDLSDSVIQAKEVFINKLTKEELEDIFS